MLTIYACVRLLTDRFQSENLRIGDLGYVIEIYEENVYEVEFSYPNGISFAQIIAQENDLELVEP